MTINRKDIIAALILAVLAILTWLPRIKGPIDLRWDGGAYYVLGTALAQGKGYRLLNEPGEIRSTLHPPMLPVIVALHQKILRTNDMITVGRWLRHFYIVLFVAYIIAAFALLRAFLSPGYAFLATLVCLFHIQTVFMSDLCFPETPFELATVLFVLCNLKDGGPTRRVMRAPLAVASYALRTIGVALLAAWAAESICERKYKQTALRFLVLLISVLSWAWYIAYVESSHEYKNPAYEYQRADYAYINVSYAHNMAYKDSFSPELGYTSLKEKAGRFLSNLALMPASLGEAVSVREPFWSTLQREINTRSGYSLLTQWTVRIPLYFLAVVIILGLGLLWLKQQYFIPLYVLFSLIVICVTPWPGQFSRYLSPLAPFLSLSLFLAVREITERLAKMLPTREIVIKRCLTGAVALMILSVQAAILFITYTKLHHQVAFDVRDGERMEYRLFFYYDIHKATDAALDWLKGQARGDEVIAATEPQWVYLRTGLKSVLPPLEMDVEKAQRLLDTVPVKFLFVDEGYFNKFTARVVAAHPDQWQQVYSNSIVGDGGVIRKFEIYERLKRGLSRDQKMGRQTSR